MTALALLAAGLAAVPAASGSGGAPIRFVDTGAGRSGEWRSVMPGLVMQSVLATPGERYRVDVRWPNGEGTLTLTLHTGALPEDDHDTDDAKNVLDFKGAPSRGPVHGEVTIPKGANGFWFTIQPVLGRPEKQMQFRVTRLK